VWLNVLQKKWAHASDLTISQGMVLRSHLNFRWLGDADPLAVALTLERNNGFSGGGLKNLFGQLI